LSRLHLIQRPLLVEPSRKAIAADVPTLRCRGVIVKAADVLPLLASRALTVIVRNCCHVRSPPLLAGGAGVVRHYLALTLCILVTLITLSL